MTDNAEAKVLSALLEDKQIHVLLSANPDKLFKTHLDIWEFIRDYHEKNKTVPPVHLIEENFSDFDAVPKVGATKYHLEELQTHYVDSRVNDIIKESAVKLAQKDPVAALNLLINKTAELKRDTASIRDLDMVDHEDATQYYERQEELNRLGLGQGIKTGLAGFDNYLPAGIMPGHFGILLAYPQIGKSWLMLYMAIQAWKHNKVPLILSLEMSEAEVRNRAYTIMGGGLFSHRKISSGDFDVESFTKWAKAYLEGKPSFPVISNDGDGEVTPAVLRGKIDQYAPDIVFVDYIQLMQSNTPQDNETVKIKNISRELKMLAGSAQVPIVAIASATPDDATNMTTVPALGQVAWSKQLAYDADWVLALGREPTSDVIEACFRKNRHGFLGEFMIETNFDLGMFRYKDFEDNS
jgi:replicative DNA helicase